MTLVRPTINLYYDNFIDGKPVPNGVSKYKLNKEYFIPVMSSTEPNDQVIKTTYFYNVMKVNQVTVNLFTKDQTASNLFYPLELSKTSFRTRLVDVIPQKTLDKIKQKKMKLLLLYQPWIGDYKLMQTLKNRVDVLIRNEVPIEQIYLVTGDINCAYQEMFGKIKVFGIDWWQIAYQLTCKTKYQNDDYHWISFLPADIKLTKDQAKRKIFNGDNWNNPTTLFTSLTGEFSTHSLALVSELIVRNLLNKNNTEFNIVKNKHINLDSKVFIDKNASQDYITLKQAAIDQLLDETLTIEDLKLSLENSLFALVSEPFSPKLDKKYLSETNALWVSPRVWEGIAQGYPFIVLGSLSTMRYLNNEGYFSYVDLFNESYDSVSNLAVKVNLIANEIDRLSKLSNEEVKERIKLTKPFIEANKKKFYDKTHTWKFYDLFKEMQYE